MESLNEKTRVLKNGSWKAKIKTIITIQEKGEKEFLKPLIEIALKDENSYIREEAVKALGELKDCSAVETLIRLLEDGNWGVRRQAAFSLGKLKDKRAIEPLVKALDDGDYWVEKAAAKALGKIILFLIESDKWKLL